MKDKLKIITSKRIKELRIAHGYTMEVLADKIGVSKSTIAKWENGYVDNMRQDNIIKLADLFEVPATYIIGYDVEKNDSVTNRDKQFERLYEYYVKLSKDQRTVIDNLLESLANKDKERK